jgi:L1 cell adhesion molecule like protein
MVGWQQCPRYLGYHVLKINFIAPRTILQLKVTFYIDPNSILNVAVDKVTEKKDKITINNYKRRISKAKFDLMVKDAENYQAENEKQK